MSTSSSFVHARAAAMSLAYRAMPVPMSVHHREKPAVAAVSGAMLLALAAVALLIGG